MGSCVSTHKNSGSTLKIQDQIMLPSHDHHDSNPNSIPSTPIKEQITLKSPTKTLAIVDPRPLSLRLKSYPSRLSSASAASFRSFGSKEEAFYDTQAWLDSDCEDDFHSVGGDFSSRGSTPSRSAVGTPLQLNRVILPQINRPVFEGRLPPRSASSLSRGSTPAHRRNLSSPQVNITYPEVVPSPNQGSTPTTKSKKLADLFRESVREQPGKSLALDGEWLDIQTEKEANPKSPASVLLPRKSGPLSESSSGKITPPDEYYGDKENTVLKFRQCCFPRLTSIRSYRENRTSSNNLNM